MINDYLVYITLAITVTAIPGPAVVLTIRTSHRYGYKVAIANIFGNFLAMLILATLSALGLGAIIVASPLLFALVKTLGCIYLLYLGLKIWRTPAINTDRYEHIKTKSNKKFSSVFTKGFGVGLSNPKAIAFFTALFPQFIDHTRAFIPQFLTLILTIEGISCVVLMGYALLSSLTVPCLSNKKNMNIFNKLTGSAFIFFGIALIYTE